MCAGLGWAHNLPLPCCCQHTTTLNYPRKAMLVSSSAVVVVRASLHRGLADTAATLLLQEARKWIWQGSRLAMVSKLAPAATALDTERRRESWSWCNGFSLFTAAAAWLLQQFWWQLAANVKVPSALPWLCPASSQPPLSSLHCTWSR